MTCTNPFDLKHEDRTIIVPCGRCRACRIQRSREWTIRLYHESLYWEDSLFVTLTYDDDSLPETLELDKTHLQTFIKTLRNRIGNRSIKYYACGEYGDRTQRPHYHAIIYGISLYEHTVKRFKTNKRYPDTVLVEKGPLRASWTKGNIIIGTVTTHSIRYVADYIQKRLYDESAEKDGRIQPFNLMSKGIGERYVNEHKTELLERQEIMLHGQLAGLPRYYAKKLGIEDSLSINQKETRAERAKDYKDFWQRSKQYDKTLQDYAIIRNKGTL